MSDIEESAFVAYTISKLAEDFAKKMVENNL